MIYKTKGVCAREINIELDGDVVKSISFYGGCDGNAQGLSRLVVGMTASDVVIRLEGIKCGRKNTSCPDQLAQALKIITTA